MSSCVPPCGENNALATAAPHDSYNGTQMVSTHVGPEAMYYCTLSKCDDSNFIQREWIIGCQVGPGLTFYGQSANLF